jgi:hypothetical protein
MLTTRLPKPLSATLLGTPKDLLSEAMEMGVSFHKGPILGYMVERSFPRAFERRVIFLLSWELV